MNIINQDKFIEQIKLTIEKPDIIYKSNNWKVINYYFKSFENKYLAIKVYFEDENNGEIIDCSTLTKQDYFATIAYARCNKLIIYEK